jgi:hypothetical protein
MYQGKQIKLQDIKDCTDKCEKIKLTKLKGLIKQGSIAQILQLAPVKGTTHNHSIPEEIQQVVHQYEHLF